MEFKLGIKIKLFYEAPSKQDNIHIFLSVK